MSQLKIISWNVNGIRAVERKNALQQLITQESPDILFIQETKAKQEQLSSYLTENENYFQYYWSAEKAGYSSVAVWLKKSAGLDKHEILQGMPDWDDNEGRIIGCNWKKFCFFGVYFPNGGKSDDAWQGKLKFYDHFLTYINQLRSEGRKVIWCGDLNVAHNEIDLARPKENEKNVGFRPEERAWMDRVLENGWIDTFREQHGDKVSYTWWNMQTRARERNVGWRIDYFLVDKKQKNKIKCSEHRNDFMGSDHCPIVLEIEL